MDTPRQTPDYMTMGGTPSSELDEGRVITGTRSGTASETSAARILRDQGNTSGPGPGVMDADILKGNDVVNAAGEDLGHIEAIMLDVQSGRVAYAVLSFGGVLGLGDKLFAIPWHALKRDADNKRFILDVDKERLEGMSGFDKDHWPSTADPKGFFGTFR